MGPYARRCVTLGHGRKAFGATVARPSGVRTAFGGSCGQILGLLFPVFRVLVTPGC